MNIQENIQRVKEIMGIVNEQLSLPTNVTGSYTASNCDELHAFQGTGGKVIGNMNVLVLDKIKQFNSQGLKVMVTDVNVQVDGMKVKWSVTINKSNDGRNWVGFTSRGAGCNSSISTRYNDESVGNGPNAITQKVEQTGIGTVDDIQLVKVFKHISGENSFIQAFYRYCLL